MTDTTKRDAVIERFMRDENDWLSWYNMYAMADRIVELEATVERQDRILAALREPTEKVTRAAVRGYSGDMVDAIRDAVAAAEQEVEHG